jgi:hypothetical protein
VEFQNNIDVLELRACVLSSKAIIPSMSSAMTLLPGPTMSAIRRDSQPRTNIRDDGSTLDFERGQHASGSSLIL